MDGPIDKLTPYQRWLKEFGYAALPDDAKPVSAVDANSIHPVHDTSEEMPWQRKERLERELAESNKKTREEIRRILGQ